MSNNRSVYHKLQKGATRLNTDAYAHQMKDHKKRSKRKNLKQFTPCAKSLTLVEECKQDKPLLLPTVIRACSEICPCHVGLRVEELLEFCLGPLVDEV